MNPWSSDFSYKYYNKLLSLLKETYTPYLFKDANKLIGVDDSIPSLLLRHDIDLDIDKALSLAEIESNEGVLSCYMFMSDCPFYSLNDKHVQGVMLKIKKMGHEIGLHYNPHFNKINNHDVFIESIDNEAKKIENIIESKVESLSFHRPIKKYIGGPFYIGGRINAYSKELMTWYLSDSKGSWRNGEPILIIKKPQGAVLQLLTHPIWWNKKHISATESLNRFFSNKTKYLSSFDTDVFDKKLSEHLTIVRDGGDNEG